MEYSGNAAFRLRLEGRRIDWKKQQQGRLHGQTLETQGAGSGGLIGQLAGDGPLGLGVSRVGSPLMGTGYRAARPPSMMSSEPVT